MCRVFIEGEAWPIVLLRPFNGYGPAQTADRVIPEVIVRTLRGEELAMTQGRQTREFNYVEDLVDGIVRAAAVPGVDGELFNLGCGEDVAIRDVTTLVLDLLGNPVTARFGALPERPDGDLDHALGRQPRQRASRLETPAHARRWPPEDHRVVPEGGCTHPSSPFIVR